eukprot:3123686-Pyramimonas_sp.AAC.1
MIIPAGNLAALSNQSAQFILTKLAMSRPAVGECTAATCALRLGEANVGDYRVVTVAGPDYEQFLPGEGEDSG